MDRPVLAITPGEPAGIGPECAVRLAAEHPELRLLFVANRSLLLETSESLGLEFKSRRWEPGETVAADTVAVHDMPLPAPARAGKLDTRNAPYVLDTLRGATALVQAGHAAALVTGPVHKGIINDAGIPFTGHTEFLADLAGVPRVVMLLAAGSVRVALVTTHLPLRDVPGAVSTAAVTETIRIVDAELRQRFGLEAARIQVLGLNPHAGEGGHLGTEDEAVIAPAIIACRADGIAVRGPVPADAAFTPRALDACDCVIAMYHDQGLPVLKHIGFGQAVNVTLGLPFIRTSVDHGTALDIVGTGRANASSLFHAASMAQDMCRNAGA
ncbi:MAG: 4-hydroxythreonine-4-phosphate dehydrogenase PdxA [Xanthomonadales bacterium]|nr:4-hydroxythreonine-4-phosphate dehydrogenase PdxA [Xanthomonadales bacterium]